MVVDIREAKLSRVEADGVVYWRDAVIVRLDECDIGTLTTCKPFILYLEVSTSTEPVSSVGVEAIKGQQATLTANNDAPCVANSTIWIVALSPALIPNFSGTFTSGRHRVPG